MTDLSEEITMSDETMTSDAFEALRSLLRVVPNPLYVQSGGYCGDQQTATLSCQYTDRGGMAEPVARALVAVVKAAPELLSEIDRLTRERDEARKAAAESAETVSRAAVTLDRLGAEVDRLTRALTEATERVEDAQFSRDSFARQFDDLQAALSEANEKIARLTDVRRRELTFVTHGDCSEHGHTRGECRDETRAWAASRLHADLERERLSVLTTTEEKA